MKSEDETLRAALDGALERLGSVPPGSGGVPLFFRLHDDAGEGVEDATVFGAALLAPLVARVADPRAAAWCRRARDFVQGERGRGGLVRFWPKGHPRHWSVPPDLDDTAAAAALCAAPPGRLARLVLALADSRGRLATWLYPRRLLDLVRFPELATARRFADPGHPVWRETEADPADADAGANAQALAWLGDRPGTERAAAWLLEVTAAGAEEGADRWHRVWGVRWLVARAAERARALAPARPRLAARVEGDLEALVSEGHALDVAFALAVAATTGSGDAACARLAGRLLEEQDGDGSWPRAPLWWGGPKRLAEWGSAVATTAVAAGALGALLARGERT